MLKYNGFCEFPELTAIDTSAMTLDEVFERTVELIDAHTP